MKSFAAVAATVAALAVAGCSSGIDTGKAQDLFQGLVQQRIDALHASVTISSTSCPSNIDNKTGTTFTCTSTLSDGSTVTGSCEVTDSSNGYVVCHGDTLKHNPAA